MKNYQKLMAAVVILGLCGMVSCNDSKENTDASQSSSHAIINGKQLTDKFYNNVVSLYDPYYKYSFCTGTLIHPQYVLTAAHCVAEVSSEKPELSTLPQDIRIAIGNTTSELRRNQFEVEEIFVNDRYGLDSNGNISDSNPNDIALIKLAKPIPETVAYPISPLPLESGITREAINNEGVEITYVGFGYDEKGHSGVKLFTTTRISSYCGAANNDNINGCYAAHVTINGCHPADPNSCFYNEELDVEIPFGSIYSEHEPGGVCNGDSGGPAFVETDIFPGIAVAGVTSWGDAACSKVDVLTAVQDFYESFILKNAPEVATYHANRKQKVNEEFASGECGHELQLVCDFINEYEGSPCSISNDRVSCGNNSNEDEEDENNQQIDSCHSTEPDVVISQIYPGGGNSGAVYNTKYIELLNRGECDANISGWSIQYSSSNKDTISSTCTLPDNVKIPKGGYYLIGMKKAANGDNIPTADFTCEDLAPSATEGKLFLVNNSNKLDSAKPESGFVDAVGYGDANWGEGGTTVRKLSAKLAAFRKKNGCFDTNNNGTDFETGTPNPRNSSAPINVCSISNVPECNNGILEEGEECDGTQFKDNISDCAEWDNELFVGGKLSCNDSCNVDYNACILSPEYLELLKCGNGILDENEECDGNLFRFGETNACSDFSSEYNTGTVTCTSICTYNFSQCADTRECKPGEVICSPQDFALKVCDSDGKWQLQSCPDDKPYCDPNARECIAVTANLSCEMGSFYPFVTADNKLISCQRHEGSSLNSNMSGKIVVDECDGECLKAKNGWGVALSNAEECSVEGKTQIYSYYNSTYKVCSECKLASDNKLHYMLIPADYYWDVKGIAGFQVGYFINRCEPI